MAIGYNHVRIRVDLKKIGENYLRLNRIGGNAVPVVKADAYGHGLWETARTLARAGARTMAAGSVGEAVKLRQMPYDGRIVALLGPVDGWDYEAVAVNRIIPFVFSLDQLERLNDVARRRETVLDVALKFDTGMARLGFSETDVPRILNLIARRPGLNIRMVCSHLAVADDPESVDFVREQAAVFRRIVAALRGGGAEFEASLANTAATLAYPDLHFDFQRPGISLYGGNPFFGTVWEEKGRGIKQAMEASAPVLQVHDLARGRSISYGRTFVAPRDMRVAIVGAGYADAWSRSLSNKGQMLLHGRRVPVVGRVCMQMTAVDVTGMDEVRAGDPVYLLGGSGEHAIHADELAGLWGTISYEVFCLLGLNPREYTDG